MIPNTHKLPAWIHSLAQDEDGAWWGFEIEPLQADRGWYENEVGRYLKLATAAPNPQWRNSLTRR